MEDAWTLVRLAAAAAFLWVLPWALVGRRRDLGGWAMAILAGLGTNVLSSYALIVLGVFTPTRALVAQGVVAAACLVGRGVGRVGRGWAGLVIPAAFVLAWRLPDAVRHVALGGNDPWGHLVLCKALAMNDALTPFHDFAFYPRGFHSLVLTWQAASGVDCYQVMRLGGPVVAILGLITTAAWVERLAGWFGALGAASVYAVPPYRHLVLPALQTALEPDRFAYVLIPCILLLGLDVVRGHGAAGRWLLVAGAVHVLVHPLSVQFAVGWLACVALAWVGTRISIQLLGLAAILVLMGWAYFHVIHASYGITVMAHLAPRSAVEVGGFGVDLGRVFLGVQHRVEPMDLLACALACWLLVRGILARERAWVATGMILLHATYAAVRDALYTGDFGHAPPYYALAFAWGLGVAAGTVPPGSRCLLPVGITGVLVIHGLVSGLPALGWAFLGVAGATAGAMARWRREGMFALFTCVALASLRPQPVVYARLGYPEAVRWALDLRAMPPGTVWSVGLVSRLPNGRPFPTQDPVRSIVWPTHRVEALSSLLTRPPDTRWTSPCWAFVETQPYQWGFQYFAEQERTRIMAEAMAWLEERKKRKAALRTVAHTSRMLLVALHEDGES